jgi:hypothetical protein
MNRYIKLAIFSGAMLSLLNLATPAFAQSMAPSPSLRPKVAEGCQAMTQRIETAIARFNNNKDGHTRRYLAVADHLKNLNEKLKAKGYDTSKPEADYKVLNEKILKASQDYQMFITKLEATKQYACGQSQGQFKTALQDAKAQLKVYREDVADIRNYYQTVVRPDVKALRDQKPNTSSSPAAQ